MGNGCCRMRADEATDYKTRQNIKSRQREIAKWQREQERLNKKSEVKKSEVKKSANKKQVKFEDVIA
jgi:hypothetical protein